MFLRSRTRQAGGIDPGEDVKPLLPSLGRMLNMYDASDVAHATYVFDYIQGFDTDPRVKAFANALAEEYASRFADWLGSVFLNRAQRVRKSKYMQELESGLADWVEHIPQILDGKASKLMASYVPEGSRRFLNWDRVEAIGAKILKVVYQDWAKDVARKMASRKRANLEQLPISYDPQWKKYVIDKSQMTYQHRNELKDLGFSYSGPKGVWFIDHLDSDVIRALPQAGKLQRGAPTPSVSVSPVDTKDWFFDEWLPSNIDRFTKVFNDYGRAEGVPYEFKFTLVGEEVEVDFRRNIQTLQQAIEEIESRYGKQDDREGWMQSLEAYRTLKSAKGKAAMHAVDMANNLEHTHGSMMEHFPAGVQRWYPAFLDFKYTAHPRAMIKKIRSEDLRTVAEELLPVQDRKERLVTPHLEHRTPKGLALEISSQKGSANKRKKLEEIKHDYPKLWPQVVEHLKGMPMPKGKKPLVGSERIPRIAARWLRQAGWEHDKAVIEKWLPGALNRQRWNQEQRDQWWKAVQTPGTPEYQRSKKILDSQPRWEKLDGNWILHVPGRPVAALPTTGKQNARNFVIFDIQKRTEIAFLRKDEVHSWLIREAMRD